MKGLYIHIPFCKGQRCSYCDFTSYTNFTPDLQKLYIDELIKEAQERASGEFDTIFIGGGTPSALYSGAISYLIERLDKLLKLSLVEFSVEMNPETASKEFIADCKMAGVNRVSLGLQTASDSLLKGLRRHTFSDFLLAVDTLFGQGISNINADLILGLPNQTADDVRSTIKRISGLNLKHISAYGLKVEEGTRLYEGGYKTDEDFIADCYDVITQSIKESFAGFARYEVSNFAQKGYECRHNLKYWSMEEYVGLGVSASSFDMQRRTTNTSSLDQYLAGKRIDYVENASDNYFTELIMLGLRTSQGIDIDKIQNFDKNFLQKRAVSDYISKGVLHISGSRLKLNESFFYVMNKVIADII